MRGEGQLCPRRVVYSRVCSSGQQDGHCLRACRDAESQAPDLQNQNVQGICVHFESLKSSALEQMQFVDSLVTIQKQAETCPPEGAKQSSAWMVVSRESAAGTVLEPCPHPSTRSVELPRSARSQAAG